MQRTVLLFILTVTGKFMPKDLLYQNRVPSTMCHKRIQGRYSMLELDEGKLSRPVLRRGVRGNSDSLADRRCVMHSCVWIGILVLTLFLSGCSDLAYWNQRTFSGIECRPEKLHNGQCVPVKKGAAHVATTRP